MPQPATTVQCVALVPAHNEEHKISTALDAMIAQSVEFTRIIVGADRCTDRTEAIALGHGVEVFRVSDNTDRKAGALNQALASLLPGLDPDDLVTVVDADTRLHPKFLEHALHRMSNPTSNGLRVGAVGAVFLGIDEPRSLIEQFQHNEYWRHAQDISRRHARADVITGTGGVFRVEALRAVAARRPDGVSTYLSTSLTEDNELTLAIKDRGYACASPRECTLETEVMPSWHDLHLQRLRWQRGALQDLHRYFPNRVILPYLAKQIAINVAVAFVPFFLLILLGATLTTGAFPWSWVWFWLGLLAVAERIWTVRRGGPKAVLLACTVIPELIYDLYLKLTFARALAEFIARSPTRWDRVENSDRRRIRTTVASSAATAALCILVLLAAVGAVAGSVQWHVCAILVVLGLVAAVVKLLNIDLFLWRYGDFELDEDCRDAAAATAPDDCALLLSPQPGRHAKPHLYEALESRPVNA
ncbi:hypothetical protein GCM10027289_27880 [Tsukamurella serpentis]